MTCLRCRHKDGSGAKFGEECALGRPKRFAAPEIHTPKHPPGSRWVKFVDKWLPGQGSSAVPNIKLPFLPDATRRPAAVDRRPRSSA